CPRARPARVRGRRSWSPKRPLASTPTSIASGRSPSPHWPTAAAPPARRWRSAMWAWPPSRPVFPRLLPDLAHPAPHFLTPLLRRLPGELQVLLGEPGAPQRGEAAHDELTWRADQFGDEVAVLRRQVEQDALGLLDHVEVGGEAGDGAVEVEHVLDEQHEVLGKAHAVALEGLGHLLELALELLGRDLQDVDRLLVGPNLVDEGIEVGAVWKGAEVGQRAELPPHVATRGGEDEPDETTPRRLVETAGDAEVDEAIAAVTGDQDVPGVEVTMEDAFDHGPFEERQHAHRQQIVGVDARLFHGVDVGEVDARQALHHQHTARDELGVRAGH